MQMIEYEPDLRLVFSVSESHKLDQTSYIKPALPFPLVAVRNHHAS